MFPYYPFLNQPTNTLYTMYSQHPIDAWKFNPYHSFDFSNQIFNPYPDSTKNHHETVL